MKHEIGIQKPECVIEDWPGKYQAFSWLEYVVSVPNPIFIITTLKSNGLPNANLHSWGLLLGSGEEFWSLLAILKQTHTYSNILAEKEWCLNYPTFSQYPAGFNTIYKNSYEDDEIRNAGFTIEESLTFQDEICEIEPLMKEIKKIQLNLYARSVEIIIM